MKQTIDPEEKRRRAAIMKDFNTIPLDFGATHPVSGFDPIDNPGIYAEDPIWKRFWKVDGIRQVNPDGSIITDQMERFRQAFELGYMACRKIEGRKS